MDIRGWDERYRSKHRSAEDFETAPAQLVVETARRLKAGTALDLACGSGRNALWLAKQGWRVTAVDGAAFAVEIVQARAGEQGVNVDAKVADLQRGGFPIEESSWDLIVIAYYLQRICSKRRSGASNREARCLRSFTRPRARKNRPGHGSGRAN